MEEYDMFLEEYVQRILNHDLNSKMSYFPIRYPWPVIEKVVKFINERSNGRLKASCDYDYKCPMQKLSIEIIEKEEE